MAGPKEIVYHAVRRYIKDGDVLLYKGTGFTSKLIRSITRSEYSHTGIAVRWNNRLMVLEARRRPGIHVIPLSKSITEYRGNIEWYTAKRHLTPRTRLRLVQFAEEEIGKKYTTVLVANNLFFRTIGITGAGTKDELVPATRIFCSYYVAQAYNHIGVDLVKNKADRYTSPGDISSSPELRFRGVLKHIPRY